MSTSSSYASGMSSRSSRRSRGVRTPDTTSSPWAFTRKSPDRSGPPVISSREKATPEHERSPVFPNTICCTLTAVPQSSGMRLMRRYSFAPSPVQEAKTARMASRSCSPGAGADRDQERVLVVAQALAAVLLKALQRVGHLLGHALGLLPAGPHVLHA